ncbi:hypothetical protein [Streptomyces sp. NPDC096013]|uniref:hypothetical protein n=1 Tax=Streptomyces sp. NPDC096013 TaxID=3366069 RepID=UPI00380A4D54
MADREDEIMAQLAHSISLVYTLLVDVCRALPVPVTLPVDSHIPAVEAVPAIQRVAALGEDQPMGEDQQTRLFSGCVHILAAIDLYALCATRYEETRAEGVGVNVLHADAALKPLLVWLLTNTG